MRQRQELSQVPGAAQGLYGTNVQYGSKQWSQQQPSTFQKIMGAVSGIAPLLGSVFGGPVGGALGGLMGGIGGSASGGTSNIYDMFNQMNWS